MSYAGCTNVRQCWLMSNNDCCWVQSHKIRLDSPTTKYWNHAIAVVIFWRAQRHEDIFSFGEISYLPGFAIHKDSGVTQQLYDGGHLRILSAALQYASLIGHTCRSFRDLHGPCTFFIFTLLRGDVLVVRIDRMRIIDFERLGQVWSKIVSTRAECDGWAGRDG